MEEQSCARQDGRAPPGRQGGGAPPLAREPASGGANGFTAEALRQVCGEFATGVAIVSTVGPEGDPLGLTINSFTSVSLAPPLVLWALNRNSPSRPAFDAGRPFAISILSEDQEDIARRFARAVPDKFSLAPHFPGQLGVPLIEEAVGHLECEAFDSFEAGDHVVYLGLVKHGARGAARPPLAFHKGVFGRIARCADSLPRPGCN